MTQLRTSLDTQRRPMAAVLRARPCAFPCPDVNSKALAAKDPATHRYTTVPQQPLGRGHCKAWSVLGSMVVAERKAVTGVMLRAKNHERESCGGR
jgi:hypothetical protein